MLSQGQEEWKPPSQGRDNRCRWWHEKATSAHPPVQSESLT